MLPLGGTLRSPSLFSLAVFSASDLRAALAALLWYFFKPSPLPFWCDNATHLRSSLQPFYSRLAAEFLPISHCSILSHLIRCFVHLIIFAFRLGINVPSVHSSISRPVAFPLRWSSAYILYQIAHTLGIGSPKIWMEFVPGGVNVCLGSILPALSLCIIM
jgi:hypothetical protein